MRALLRLALLAVLLCPLRSVPAEEPEYIWPLDGFKQVSGTFAEFRGTHFHSGLDISTQGSPGQPVICSRGGKITRVKVSQSGFGRALYVTHPDGTVAVYGHLQNFFPALEEEVFKKQLKQNGFALDFEPDRNYEAKQGQVIALSGNSGTTAPHLHFELRSPAQHPVDPTAALGASYETWPVTGRLVFYPLSESSRVNGSSVPVTIVPKNLGVNYILKNTISFSGYLGIGIDTVQLNWQNKLGVKEITLEADGKIVLQYTFDRFSYNDYRKTGAFYDRGIYLTDKAHVIKLFCPQGAAPVFTKDKNDTRGVFTSGRDGQYIRLGAGRHKIKITVTAFDGKTSKTEFKLNSVPFPQSTEPVTTGLSDGSIEIKTPDNEAVLKTGPWTRRSLPLEKFKAATIENLSKRPPELELHTLAYSFAPDSAESPDSTVTIKIPKQFKAHKDKVRIYELSGTDWSYAGGEVDTKNGAISLKTTYFGTFTVGLDTRAPDIKLKNLPAFERGGFVEFEARDNGSGIDIDSAVLTIDSLPCFPYFNRKTQTFIWPVHRRLTPGQHKIEVKIRDRAGNGRTLEQSFTVMTN